MLEPMVKVEIIGHRSRLDLTLGCLQGSAALQLVDAAAVLNVGPLGADEDHLREGEQLRHLRTRLDSLVALGAVPADLEPAEVGDADVMAVWAELEELAPTIEPIVARIDALEAEQGVLPKHLVSLRRLVPLVPEIPELAAYETVALLIDRRHAAVVGNLRDELATLVGGRFELLSGQIDSTTVGAVLVFARSDSRRVHTLLAAQQVSRIQLPDQFLGLPFAGAIASMERRIADLPSELEAARGELTRLLSSRPHWHTVRSYVDLRLDQLDALRNVGTTARTFAIVGWVPRRELDRLMDALASDVGNDVLVQELDVADDESPPVLLANPRAARPFQLFLGLLALPRYGTFDPTVLMALFMPFFFGLMLGDVAYGLIVLGLAGWARRRWGHRSDVVADLGRVFAMGAVWAVAWGVVFGEVFGDLGRRVTGLEPLWMDRQEAIGPLMLLALAIGATHVVLGLVLGLWVSARTADRRLFGERAALLVALCALFAAAGVATDRLPAGVMTPSVAAVVVALVVMIALRWPLGLVTGPLGLVGAITNVLSYLRIAAIGLASVFLARVANELATTAPLVLGVMIGALFHAMNLALGAFSPAIQALRLHYVEFFDKFYEPGGELFVPFGLGGTSVPALSHAIGASVDV
ncbi:MAG TPA: V-type ATPase 116kDa subunit family protein [Acidimicrobiia bacterium]